MAVGRYRHLTIILYKKQIYSIGASSNKKTHPWNLKFGYKYPFRHSETHAITSFPFPVRELKYFTIVNIRYMSDGKSVGNSRPCKFCKEMLKSFGIQEIYHSTNEGDLVKCVL